MNQLERPDGETIAYQHQPGTAPGILFCAGFNSNMQGDKALALAAWCREQGRQYTRFDYFGHGDSSGRFQDGTIGRWCDDTLAVLDQVTQGPQVIVGSSMGGWMMLLAALARPDKVLGLLGVAAAPDFTEGLRGEALNAAQRQQLASDGYFEIDNCYDEGAPYCIGGQLPEEAGQHLLLTRETLPVAVPVRLIHGQCDADVPWQNALKLAAKLAGDDVEVQLVKGGEHRLSTAADLRRLVRTLEALLEDLGV